MTLEVAAFWAFASILVAAAAAAVIGKNLFHSVLWLALALVSTAGVFLLLDAEFVAAVQILLYAGGVVTVIVFAIVVTERLVGERLSQTNRRIFEGGLVSAGLMFLLIRAIARADLGGIVKAEVPADLTPRIGTALLTQFVLPFELLAVLLLVGLLGASYFARPEE
jgi:NADH-quinone oxidoreductase subunit J